MLTNTKVRRTASGVTIYRNIAILLLLTLMLGGCAGTIREKGYKAFGSYVIAEETAADLIENPLIDRKTTIYLQDTLKITAPAAESLYKALDAYARLEDEIKGIKDAGHDPGIEKLLALDAALKTLQTQYALSLPQIAAITEAVNQFGGRIGDR